MFWLRSRWGTISPTFMRLVACGLQVAAQCGAHRTARMGTSPTHHLHCEHRHKKTDEDKRKSPDPINATNSYFSRGTQPRL
jgi:hypothetical protein